MIRAFLGGWVMTQSVARSLRRALRAVLVAGLFAALGAASADAQSIKIGGLHATGDSRYVAPLS